MIAMKIVIDTIIEEVRIIIIVEIPVEEITETEIPVKGTTETEILGEEIPIEEITETEILGEETPVEGTTETETLGTDLGAGKRRFLLTMIGRAQSVTTLIFLSVKNVTVVVSQRVVVPVEEITEDAETVNQEMTGQAGVTESQENLEKQEVNPQITPTTGDRNRLMLVLEEEIAMIK